MDIVTITEFIILAVMVICMIKLFIDRKDTVSKTEQKLYEKKSKEAKKRQ